MHPVTASARRQVYRGRAQSVSLLVIALAYCGMTTPLALRIPGLLAAMVGVTAALLWCAAACVRVGDTGIRVVNPFGIRRVPWDAIESFSVGRAGPLQRVALVHLAGGGTHYLFGIQGANPRTQPGPGLAERLVAELNEELRRRRR
jgi:hypothetical protein